jgi:hypothetical protein
MSRLAISSTHSSANHLPPPDAAPARSPAAPSSLERLMQASERVPVASGFSQLIRPTTADARSVPSPRPNQKPTSANLSRGVEFHPPTPVPAKRTPLSAQTLRETIARCRPDLPPQAVALLVAQSSIETGRFGHCYNFNIGNTKCGAHVPHTYLRNTWEMLSPAQAQRAANSPLCHLCRFEPDLSTIDPSNGAARIRVTFQPPHPQTRFRAHASLEEGVREWLGFVEKLSSRHPEIAEALRAGDTKGYARSLKHAGYFTASAAAYANALSSHLRIVTRELHP